MEPASRFTSLRPFIASCMIFSSTVANIKSPMKARITGEFYREPAPIHRSSYRRKVGLNAARARTARIYQQHMAEQIDKDDD